MQKFSNNVDFSLMGEVIKKHKNLLTDSFFCDKIEKVNDFFVFSFRNAKLKMSDCYIKYSSIYGGTYNNINFINSSFSINNVSVFSNCSISSTGPVFFDCYDETKLINCRIENNTFDDTTYLDCINCNFLNIEVVKLDSSKFNICNIHIKDLMLIGGCIFTNCNIIIDELDYHFDMWGTTFNKCTITYKGKKHNINGIITNINDFKKELGITNENNDEID